MKYYSGYNKPYIYAAFDSSIEERVNEILKPLDDKGVLFWHSNIINKKELNKIEMAFSIIVFVTNDFVKTKEFHDIINHAVSKNKEILTIYLEEVELDAWGHMQLDSLQYLNVNQNDFESRLLEASIFKDMKVTDAQKRFQRRTTIAAIATPILAGILAFFLIIEPLLIAPTRINSDTLGLNGLTQEELDSITELYIMGDQVYKDENVDRTHCRPNNTNKNIMYGEVNGHLPDGTFLTEQINTINRGSISDLNDLAKLRNLKRLCISGQQITDISPLFSLTQLEYLGLECNPITSIEGINQLTNLQSLFLTGTDIEDLSPLNGLSNVHELAFDCTPVKVYPDTNFLSKLTFFDIGGTSDIPYFGNHNTPFSDFVNLDGSEVKNIHDFSFMKDITRFDLFRFNDLTLEEVKPYIENCYFKEFNVSNFHDLYSLEQLDFLNVSQRLDLCWTYSLVSLRGVEKFDGIEYLVIKNCYNIQDFYLLNNLKNTKYVVISSDMKGMVLSQLNDDVRFEIRYEDD